MIYIFVWLISSALAFAALRHFALRDFGTITIGGAIGLVLFSLIAPAALILALTLSLQGRGRFLGKVVWTRGRE